MFCGLIFKTKRNWININGGIMTNNKELQKINEDIDKLQKNLMDQLQTTSIVYIDLYYYYSTLNLLKNKRTSLIYSDDI